jgi:hypothetical protein
MKYIQDLCESTRQGIYLVTNSKEISSYSRPLWRLIIFAGLTFAIAQPAFAIYAGFPAEVIMLDGGNNVTGKVRNVQIDIGDNSKNPVKVDKHPLVFVFPVLQW